MNYPQNECSDFFKTLFVENLTREECHTILVWKEKWEEIRQKSVKDWKINEAENPMVWMQEISLLCHPSVNGSSLSFFQISHLLWAQPKCYEKLQISRKIAFDWMLVMIIHRRRGFTKKPSLEFYCLRSSYVLIFLFVTRSSILGFSRAALSPI